MGIVDNVILALLTSWTGVLGVLGSILALTVIPVVYCDLYQDDP